MSDNIFGNDQQTPPAGEENGKATPLNVQSDANFANLLSSIKNERGEQKYKDVQTALEALRHAQEFIPQLKSDKEQYEQKLNELTAEVNRLKNIENTVSQLTQQQQKADPQPAAPVITEEVVANLVNQTLTVREQQALREQNIKTVVTKLQEQFGAEADKTFYAKAAELGLTNEQINDLASKSPAVVLKLFNVEPQPQVKNTSTVSTSINTTNLQPQKQSFIGRNTSSMMVGATTKDLQAERERSKSLVAELHGQNLTTADLTDPKVYFKHFGNSN